VRNHTRLKPARARQRGLARAPEGMSTGDGDTERYLSDLYLSEGGHVVGTTNRCSSWFFASPEPDRDTSGAGRLAFRWWRGQVADLGGPVGTGTEALAVNQRGQIMLLRLLSPATNQGVLWDHGTVLELPPSTPPGLFIFVALNDNPQIVEHDGPRLWTVGRTAR
jgi:hypothetical protein